MQEGRKEDDQESISFRKETLFENILRVQILWIKVEMFCMSIFCCKKTAIIATVTSHEIYDLPSTF